MVEALPPPPAPELPVVETLLPLDKPIVLDEAALHFALNKAVIPPQGIEVLRTWALRIKALDHTPHLKVSGYSDSTGRRAHNMTLSLGRAKAVAVVLASEGLVMDKVEGLGPDAPIAPNTNTEGRARNRRVEIRLQAEGVQVEGHIENQPVPEISPSSTRRIRKPKKLR